MKHHTLSGTDLAVSALCQSAALFGTALKGDAMVRLYDTFRAAGGNFFDTAHCYCFWVAGGDSASERGLGECLRRRGDRDQIIIGTKGGHPARDPGYPRPDRCLSPQIIARDITESLERLGVAQLDLYYLHRDDRRHSVAEIMDTLHAEIDRGRVRYLGASNWTTSRIEAANAYAQSRGRQGFVASQPHWNLAQQNPPSDTALQGVSLADENWYARQPLTVVAYSPTANGYFATGGERGREAYDNPTSRARLTRAQQLAAQLQVTPNQIAIAWLMSQPFPVIPIPGTANLDHHADALAAAELSLTAEQLRWLRG